MRLTDPSLITIDTIFYTVMVFSDHRCLKNTYVEKLKAVDNPYKDPHSWWVNCIRQSFSEDHMVLSIKADFDTNKIVEGWRATTIPSPRDISLQDCGVMANTYNDHQTFDSYSDAIQYIRNYYQIDFEDMFETNNKYKAYERAMGIL